MKQFTKEELLELKYDVAHRMERDSYKDLIFVYYTSLEVLQYLDTLGEENVKQIDLQFWTNANESAIRYAPQIESEIIPLFEETMEFEDALQKARQKCSQPYNLYDWKRYRKMQAERKQREEYYQNLRQLAGIYLDILSDNPQDEHYKLWLNHYDRLSVILDEKRRGFAEDDEARLSLAEMELMLQKLKSHNHIGEYAGCWDKEIKRFEEMIEKRKAEA